MTKEIAFTEGLKAGTQIKEGKAILTDFFRYFNSLPINMRTSFIIGIKTGRN
ncbi:hypothetical protein EST35_0102 [Pseudomonas phage vB_PaeM_PA5oct]|uniref:Uncharacterized protein n=1 Tax=Pseudomonas phage vB_PaeM_PA5oct TaxID=2163605 RepID=A0A4Y5JTK2_9CAUD|nr:hypothetical protein PQE65_gp381 [Pseudomonas phage vB_PaeM_PA5oct]QCG75984.1 hypothetical protein EST35_0102 [Pseudomonas phage vB_PaeM_PA5oct]